MVLIIQFSWTSWTWFDFILDYPSFEIFQGKRNTLFLRFLCHLKTEIFFCCFWFLWIRSIHTHIYTTVSVIFFLFFSLPKHTAGLAVLGEPVRSSFGETMQHRTTSSIRYHGGKIVPTFQATISSLMPDSLFTFPFTYPLPIVREKTSTCIANGIWSLLFDS